MFVSNIADHNYELLSNLKGKEILGVDDSGRVYVIDKGSFLSILVQKVFRDQKRVQQAVESFVVDKLREKEFHDIALGRERYLRLLGLFGDDQLSSEKRSVLAFDYYNQRYRDLVSQGGDLWRAEARLVLEMLNDPNIPSSFKNSIAPEPFEFGYYLKDRAGRIIAQTNDLSTF